MKLYIICPTVDQYKDVESFNDKVDGEGTKGLPSRADQFSKRLGSLYLMMYKLKNQLLMSTSVVVYICSMVYLNQNLSSLDM